MVPRSTGPLLLALLLAPAASLSAHKLDLTCFGAAEGLPHSRVSALAPTDRGLLWAGTWEGVGRFDGVELEQLGLAEGLPHPLVTTVVDTAKALWVGTEGGLAYLARGAERLTAPPPAAGRTFVPVGLGDTVADRRVHTCVQDAAADALWCASDGGLFSASLARLPPRFSRVLRRRPEDAEWRGLVEVPGGGVWLGAGASLLRVRGREVTDTGGPGAPIVALAPSVDGLWVATRNEVYSVVAADGTWRRLGWTVEGRAQITALLGAAHGRLWAATSQGLVHWGGGTAVRFTRRDGLPDDSVLSLAADREGDLWVGTAGGGFCRLRVESSEVASWGEELTDPEIVKLAAGRAGQVVATTADDGLLILHAGSPQSATADPRFAAVGRRLATDERGAWWLGTDEGLYFMPGPGLDPSRVRRLGKPERLPEAAVEALVTDPAGRIWVRFAAAGWFRLDRRASSSLAFSPVELPAVGAVNALATDRAGDLWVAGSRGLARVDAAGRIWKAEPRSGLPAGSVRCLRVDRQGWLWVGLAERGLAFSIDPAVASPPFTPMPRASGLDTGAIAALAEDRWGRIYAGTGHGVGQVDRDSLRARRYSARDGLAGDLINDLAADSAGHLWVATATGLSRLDPRPPRPPGPPRPVWLSGVEVAGTPLELPIHGARALSGVVLRGGESSVAVRYFSSTLAAHPLYQSRLLGGESAGWSEPTESTTLRLAHLAPGAYRLEVRALDEQGSASDEPATLGLRVLPPWWRRPELLTVGGALVVGATLWIQRLRRERALALERLRLEIAADLHDDLGAGLAEIAIRSEAARRGRAGSDRDALAEIAERARALRESMADIVWTIDPRRDRLSSWSVRLRRWTVDALEGAGLEAELAVATDAELDRVRLDPSERRHLFLFVKEAITNTIRHAGARKARLTLTSAHGALTLTVADDGHGFDSAQPTFGHGLANLRGRAAALGGRLAIDSQVGGGTIVRLVVPGRGHSRRPQNQPSRPR